LGGSLAGCIVAGIVFAFCGFTTAWQGYPIGDSGIWLPMICYSVHRLWCDHSPKSIALLSLSFAMPVLAGHPETAAHLTLVGCALALAHVLAGDYSSKRFIALFVVAAVLAIGLASVQILPTVEWLSELKQNLSVPEPALGRHDGQGFFSRDILTSPSSALVPVPEAASYAGMLSVLLLPFALFYRPRRYVWFFVGIVLVALAVAFSIQPVHWIVERLPFIKAWKNGRLILVADFGIAALAGFGITVLEREISSKRIATMLLVFATAITLAGIYEVHLATQSHAAFLRGPAGSMIFLGAAFVLIGLRISGKLHASSFQTLVCGLAAVEMISFAYGFLGFTKANEIFPKAPLFDFLSNQGPVGTFRIAKAGYPIPANSGMIYGFEMAEGYDLTTARARLFTDGLREDRDEAIFFRIDEVVNMPDRRFDLLNVKYVIVMYPGREFDLLSRTEDRFRIVYKEPGIAVFENKSALPRVFAVPQSGVEVITDPLKQLSRVRDASFDPARHVILPQAPAIVRESNVPLSSKIDVLQYGANGTQLRTETSAPSVLVLSQIAYPGWQASIDGREAPILLADFALAGVALPEGIHQVSITFRPRLLLIGAIISGLSLIGIASLAVAEKMRKMGNR
jgi:hypothetical protein